LIPVSLSSESLSLVRQRQHCQRPPHRPLCRHPLLGLRVVPPAARTARAPELGCTPSGRQNRRQRGQRRADLCRSSILFRFNLFLFVSPDLGPSASSKARPLSCRAPRLGSVSGQRSGRQRCDPNLPSGLGEDPAGLVFGTGNACPSGGWALMGTRVRRVPETRWKIGSRSQQWRPIHVRAWCDAPVACPPAEYRIRAGQDLLGGRRDWTVPRGVPHTLGDIAVRRPQVGA